ncbi:MAG TPA: pyridoxal phosphate-dependent aminotransferase [Syntrophorhabdaceae bacterium]|nr:pyridoxal phosphate-dependent aminotransferase [Syntrophorhabdaceae bacterium]HOT42986.1 pyridoxal phosphate-dependent aminotransferase [Syntrophorhabdaceae bacterium]HPC66835.1 pyridoxal phosphate-dependent aminotransferase [Syntrophorhabdaceae bacterium]HQE79349.1 pyridoxal phosphate-dependent aminotransferase [Syntrophorhabdaceae bacterium]HQH43002.1 pyridoxal phosphate-dependent aminotransferase [Syntrophorhabdaceae bacterium]
MLVSNTIKKQMEETGWIRRMFEEGINMKKIHGDANVFDFSLGNPFIEPPEQLIRALIDTLNDPVPGMHRYMPNNGYEEVRDEIAVYLREFYNMPFTAEHVYMSAGSAGGINILLKSMLNSGDEVIVPKPYFMEYKYYIESHGGAIKTVSTDEQFQLDMEKIDAAITPKTKAILINSPNNPTGVVYGEEKLRELAEILTDYRKKGQDIYIISDDAYKKLVFDNITLPNIFKIYDLVISVTSHSKDLAVPGERIGYIAISPKIKEVKSLISALMFSSRALGFVNAPALFQRVIGKFQKNSIDIMDYQEKRDFIYNTLIEAGFECVKPQGAFYVFPKSPMKDELKFVKLMQEEERILAVPGRGFGKSGYFRIAYCVPFDKIVRAADGFKNMGKRYIRKG